MVIQPSENFIVILFSLYGLTSFVSFNFLFFTAELFESYKFNSIIRFVSNSSGVGSLKPLQIFLCVRIEPEHIDFLQIEQLIISLDRFLFASFFKYLYSGSFQ